MKPLKVCIVGGKCLDLIADNPVLRYLGGIETQLVALAKGLVQEGCEVSLITFDHGQPDESWFHGVRVLKGYRVTGGIPAIRWLGRTKHLWRAMAGADADIYLQMGAGLETGLAALGCGRKGEGRKRFVYCLASDTNYSTDLTAGRFGWEGKLYKIGLRRADLVLAQTAGQQEGLRHAAGIESLVIPMAVASPAGGIPQTAIDGSPPRVLWLGRITPVKRLEWLLEIARRCPRFAFDVVGSANRASEYANALIQEAARLPNVKVHGRISGGELGKLYAAARVLCCTATQEGFPSVFLEAWSCGIPVVTNFDPDGIVARLGLGRVGATAGDMAAQLEQMLADPEAYGRLSQTVRRYHSENHSVGAVSRRFRSCFEALLAADPAVAGQ